MAFCTLRCSFFLVLCAPNRSDRLNSCQFRLMVSMHDGLRAKGSAPIPQDAQSGTHVQSGSPLPETPAF